MHQRFRPPPITASPANSPRTNPARTNNPRDQDNRRSDNAAERGTSSEQGSSVGEGSDASMRAQEVVGQGRDSLAKMSQVIQVRPQPADLSAMAAGDFNCNPLTPLLLKNYFTKAALIVLHARCSLPPAYAKGSETKRVNKWVSENSGPFGGLKSSKYVRECS